MTDLDAAALDAAETRVRGEIANLAAAETENEGADYGGWYALSAGGYIAAKVEREDLEALLAAVTALRAERDALQRDLDDCFAQQGDLVGRLTAELDALRESVRLADAYIDKSPCYPDIYADQWEAWKLYDADRAARHAPGVSDGE